MGQVYVAMSPLMQEWGGDVGISKNIYKVGYTDEDPKDAAAQLNADGYAGQKDWELLGARALDGVDGETLATRLKERHKLIDPLYYPRIKGAKDIVKVDQRKVEANLVIKRTMEGRDSKVPKLKPKDIADYLLDSVA
jgi:hypothetical protein